MSQLLSSSSPSMALVVAATSNTDGDLNSISNSGTRSGAVVFDSLPYIDNIHANYEQYAISLLEQEMQLQEQQNDISKLHPCIQPLPAQFNVTSDMITKTKSPIAGMSTSIPTTRKFPYKPVNENSIEEWTETIRNARIVYEQERIRNIFLNLDKEEEAVQLGKAASKNDGVNATTQPPTILTSCAVLLKRYIEELFMKQKEYYDIVLQQQQNAVTTINYHRQQHQVEQYQPKLLYYITTIENELLQKIYALKLAIYNLQQELHQQEEQQKHLLQHQHE